MNLRFFGLIISIILFIFIISKRFINKWFKGFLLLASFGLILSMAFLFVVPMTSPPRPRGEMEVSTDMVFYKHETKYPEMETGNGEREIPVNIWHPKVLKENNQPLLLFSHGAFGVGKSNETMYLELASRGYIVMSLDHPYQSFKTNLSDGSSVMVDFNFVKSAMNSQGANDLEETLKSLKSWSEIRLEDMNFVLDKILDKKIDNKYEEYIDKNRIVLSGHSLGGSAALAIGRERSSEINALVILESPFIQDIQGIEGDNYIFTEEEYPLPILHIYSDYIYDNLENITTYEMNDRLIKSGDPKFVNVHIQGVGHLGLTDMALVSPIITNRIDGNLNKRKAPETLLEINRFVVEFLEVYNK